MRKLRPGFGSLPAPVNRFPDFVRYTVQRLKILCPAMGRVKMAQTLARAGLHLGSTTVRGMLQEKPCPEPTRQDTEMHGSGRVVTAKRPNHVWHVDLTTVPIGGFWTSWLPFSLPQRWPFCWWVAVAVDHYSRRVMGRAAFDRQPTSEAVRHFLGPPSVADLRPRRRAGTGYGESPGFSCPPRAADD